MLQGTASQPAERSEGGASDQTIMGIAGHVSRKMLEHYSRTRRAAKRRALELLGHDTVMAQSRLFPEKEIPK